jgi:hypothetical protein
MEGTSEQYHALFYTQPNYSEMRASLAEAENEFTNLDKFIINCQNAIGNIINVLFKFEEDKDGEVESVSIYLKHNIPDNQSIINDRQYYDLDYSLNSFEYYLTKFFIGFYVLKYINEADTKYCSTQILAETKRDNTKFKFRINFNESIGNIDDDYSNDHYWKLEINSDFNSDKIEMQQFNNQDIETYIYPEKIGTFENIENELFLNKLLNAEGVWIGEKKILVAFLYFLRKFNYSRVLIKGKDKLNSIKYLKWYFQKRYSIDISQEMKPSRFSPESDLNEFKGDFILIIPELKIKE